MGWWAEYKSYFRNNPERDAPIYLVVVLVFIIYSVCV